MSLAPAPLVNPDAVRVLIVDDSAIVRTLTTRWIGEAKDVVVAGVAHNGREGVELAGKLKPDVVILDVEMPEMDGLAAIPQILRAAPLARILMASTLTRRNAEVTLRALSLGATDYIAKPESAVLSGAADFKRDLMFKIRALKPVRVRPAPPRLAPAPPRRAARATPTEIVLIGASTGGPEALRTIVSALAGRVRQPILIVQHMPPVFTAILAEHLSKTSSTPAVEAKDGMPLKPFSIYLAPGDHHMRVQRRHGAPVITLDRGPPVNFCRPAVDPLFESAAEVFGAGVLAVVLTGMGVDGRTGAGKLAGAGADVLAQDEATSVVWGMPGAVAQAGHAAQILPLTQIASTILMHTQGSPAAGARPSLAGGA